MLYLKPITFITTILKTNAVETQYLNVLEVKLLNTQMQKFELVLKKLSGTRMSAHRYSQVSIVTFHIVCTVVSTCQLGLNGFVVVPAGEHQLPHKQMCSNLQGEWTRTLDPGGELTGYQHHTEYIVTFFQIISRLYYMIFKEFRHLL